MSESAVHTTHLITRAESLSIAIPGVIDFLDDYPTLPTSEIDVVTAFLIAAEALVALPSYQEYNDAQEVEKHCVRCHTTFTEKNNGPSACSIPHVFTTEAECTGSTSWDSIYSYACRSAYCSARLEEEGKGSWLWLNLKALGRCYRGYHTTDEEDVEDDPGYNEVNILTCELDEKSRKCVTDGAGGKEPIFEDDF
jgi:hypothetical protein